MTMLRILLVLLSCAIVLSQTTKEGLAFLEAKKLEPNVIALPSGLLYKVLKKGNGAYHPGPATSCSCHYHGTLPDGTVFDSSVERGSPTTFAPNQVIAGWTEAMQLMVAGDQWELYLPSELAYGTRGSPPKIPSNSVLVFTIEILEITGHGAVEALQCQLDGTDCIEKEVQYIAKVQSWEAIKVQTETQRLTTMKDKDMAPDLAYWMARRLHILKQMGKDDQEEEKEDDDIKEEETKEDAKDEL